MGILQAFLDQLFFSAVDVPLHGLNMSCCDPELGNPDEGKQCACFPETKICKVVHEKERLGLAGRWRQADQGRYSYSNTTQIIWNVHGLMPKRPMNRWNMRRRTTGALFRVDSSRS